MWAVYYFTYEEQFGLFAKDLEYVHKLLLIKNKAG